jgi:hypothetical protein
MAVSATDVTRAALQQAAGTLHQSAEKIRHCVEQLTFEQLWWRPEPSMNSIGNLLLHLTGNLRQWVVSGLGGAPDIRHRPTEFSQHESATSEELLTNLEAVVAESISVLTEISSDEMLRSRRIQGFDVTGWAALFDTVPHFKGHTQEVTCLTRMQLGPQYRFHWQPGNAEQGAG